MATLVSFRGVKVATAVNFHIGEGLRPDANMTLTSPTGSTMELMLDHTELMRLVSGLHSDPRFVIDKRAGKRDKNNDSAVDDLLSKARGK